VEIKDLASWNGTSQSREDYGRALLSQNAGWTMAEFSRPLNGDEGSAVSNGQLEEALAKTSQQPEKPEKVS
jgi:hypothetical protein